MRKSEVLLALPLSCLAKKDKAVKQEPSSAAVKVNGKASIAFGGGGLGPRVGVSTIFTGLVIYSLR